MTVEQLRHSLLGIQGDLPVVLARDPEGNGFSVVSTAQVDHFAFDNAYNGDVYNADDPDAPDTEPVLVLWPVN